MTDSSTPRNSDIVTLVVGGITYRLARSKLTAYPRTKLAAILDDATERPDKNGAYVFPQRNGQAFEFIFHFYEDDGAFPDVTMAVLQDTMGYAWEEVWSECQFFRIPLQRTTFWKGSYSIIYRSADNLAKNLGLLVHRSIENCCNYATVTLWSGGMVQAFCGDDRSSCEETKEVDFVDHGPDGAAGLEAMYRFLAEPKCKQIRKRILDNVLAIKPSANFGLTIGKPQKHYERGSFIKIECYDILDYNLL
ncbi:hypothetical protein BC936DRAFT_136705 [Jimgerdemannia flammicorona]|uniref:Uncharacterized protein n=2 Tax=Jimgerdemannia flammicorona TaxID=994334 RepID=A0A433CYZ4_9FUNG|nr:hypothetical protein BC936DRAFT_136705 [Jimgerdemannia flammicorona]RUS23689.1 hypothetical protein BC938DRAFT_474766 [Jimgerdemannia flammicorona]